MLQPYNLFITISLVACSVCASAHPADPAAIVPESETAVEALPNEEIVLTERSLNTIPSVQLDLPGNDPGPGPASPYETFAPDQPHESTHLGGDYHHFGPGYDHDDHVPAPAPFDPDWHSGHAFNDRFHRRRRSHAPGAAEGSVDVHSVTSNDHHDDHDDDHRDDHPDDHQPGSADSLSNPFSDTHDTDDHEHHHAGGSGYGMHGDEDMHGSGHYHEHHAGGSDGMHGDEDMHGSDDGAGYHGHDGGHHDGGDGQGPDYLPHSIKEGLDHFADYQSQEYHPDHHHPMEYPDNHHPMGSADDSPSEDDPCADQCAPQCEQCSEPCDSPFSADCKQCVTEQDCQGCYDCHMAAAGEGSAEGPDTVVAVSTNEHSSQHSSDLADDYASHVVENRVVPGKGPGLGQSARQPPEDGVRGAYPVAPAAAQMASVGADAPAPDDGHLTDAQNKEFGSLQAGDIVGGAAKKQWHDLEKRDATGSADADAGAAAVATGAGAAAATAAGSAASSFAEDDGNGNKHHVEAVATADKDNGNDADAEADAKKSADSHDSDTTDNGELSRAQEKMFDAMEEGDVKPLHDTKTVPEAELLQDGVQVNDKSKFGFGALLKAVGLKDENAQDYYDYGYGQGQPVHPPSGSGSGLGRTGANADSVALSMIDGPKATKVAKNLFEDLHQIDGHIYSKK